MAYERILAHPSRSEAISLTGNGVLTRWALGSKPLRLAQVITEFDRTGMDLAASPNEEEFYLVNKTDSVECRRWTDLAVAGEISCPSGTEPHRVAVSPDGLTLAVSGFGVGDYLIAATTGQIKNVLSGEPGLYIRFSPNGRWLACAENGQSGGTLSLYEIEADGLLRGRYALKAFEPSTYSLVNPVFSPDSQWIAVYQTDDFIYSEDPSGWFGNILLFAVEAGEGRWLAGLEAPGLSVEIAGRSEEERILDPTNLFFGNGEIVCGLPSGELVFLSTANGEMTRKIQVDPEIPLTSVAIDSSLHALWVTLDSGEVKCVAVMPSSDVISAPPVAQPSLEAVMELDHERSVTGLAFSPNGTRLVTLSTDKTARMWDTANGLERLTLPLGMEAVTLDFSGDGSHFAVGGDKLLLFDAHTGQEMLRIDESEMYFNRIAFSPDGRYLHCDLSNQAPLLLEVATGRKEFAPRGPEARNLAGRVAATQEAIRPGAVSPDGALLAEIDGSIFGAKIRDALTGQELYRVTGHADSVSCLAFSPDSKQIATGSWDRTVKIWRMPF